MRKTTSAVIVACGFLATGWLLSQQSKPNFSGVWKLNKEKSVLTFPTMRQPGGGEAAMGGGGPRGGGGGTGGGGGVSFNIPQMGGPGLGGPGRGGRPHGAGPGRDPRLMGVGEKVEIAHEEPSFVVKTTYDPGDGQFIEWHLTTDGTKKETTLGDGSTLKSKSTWKKDRLTTKSTIETSTSHMETTEERTLSQDGKTMTVKLTTASMFMYWSRTLVYDKAE